VQAFVFLVVTLPAIYGTYRTIYKDIIPKSDVTLSQRGVIKPFPQDDPSFKILILPFDPLEDCTIQDTDMGKTIFKRLVELKEQDSLNISVRYETNQSCPSGFEEGESIGKGLNADLVLWGETYERCAIDTLKACLRYVLLGGENIPIGTHGSTDIQSVPSMTDISQGYLQKNIDYVVFWTLGSEAYTQGRYRTAVARFDRVLNLSPNDPESLNWSGLSLSAAGNYAEAEPLFRRGLEIREAQLGKDHLDVANSLNNLAALFWAQGNYAEAEPLFRRALVIWEAQLGKDHPNTQTARRNLKSLLDKMQRANK